MEKSAKVSSLNNERILYYLRQPLVRFMIVGGFGTLLKLASMFIMVELVHLHYLVAYVASFVLVVSSNYVWNSLWTFRQKTTTSGFAKYTLISSASLGMREGLMYLLTDIWGLWYMISTAVLIFAGFLFNYSLGRRWVWQRQ